LRSVSIVRMRKWRSAQSIDCADRQNAHNTYFRSAKWRRLPQVCTGFAFRRSSYSQAPLHTLTWILRKRKTTFFVVASQYTTSFRHFDWLKYDTGSVIYKIVYNHNRDFRCIYYTGALYRTVSKLIVYIPLWWYQRLRNLEHICKKLI